MLESVQTSNPNFLTREKAASFLSDLGMPVAKTTLGKLACIGGGPTFHKFGQRTLYKPSDLLAWAESRTSKPLSSTSEVA